MADEILLRRSNLNPAEDEDNTDENFDAGAYLESLTVRAFWTTVFHSSSALLQWASEESGLS